MIFLFDQNISFRVVKGLQKIGINALHVSDCGLYNADDKQIWEYAKINNQIIITHDDDFDNIFAINGFPPKIIKLNTGNLSNTQTIELFLRHKVQIEEFCLNQENGFLIFFEINP